MNEKRTCPDCGNESLRKTSRGIACSECGYHELSTDFLSRSNDEQNRKKKKKPDYAFSADKLLIKNWNITKAMIEKADPPRVVQRFSKNIYGACVYYEFIPPRKPKQGSQIEACEYLSDKIKQALLDLQYKSLYEFQERSLQYIQEGKNVVITAPTGSGKTEGFVLPVLEQALKTKKQPVAFLIYPTKALAKDQYKKLLPLCKKIGLSVAVYDGDTPQHERIKILSTPPSIIITNPDMIHYHLIYNEAFRTLIPKLQFLVIDEVHQMIGSYGTAVFFLIKRMMRYNPNLRFIAASATISNPQEFCKTLFGTPLEHIDVSDARMAPTHIMLLYPKGVSHYTLITNLARTAVRETRKTLVFSNSHSGSETLFQIFKQFNIRAEIHRGGLSSSHRETAEKRFREGNLKILISTPTLELGIDIGEVDTVISELIDITRFTQRIGRGGRKGQDAFGLLVLRNDDPISAFYSHYPRQYFEDVASAYVDPNNELIAKKHLLAAAEEAPLFADEFPDYDEVIRSMISDRLLNGKYPGPLLPTLRGKRELKNYNLRGIGEQVKIVVGNKTIGFRSLPMALRELHPGAIYLHGGRCYSVISLNLDDPVKRTEVQPRRFDGKKTEALREMYPEVLKVLETKNHAGIQLAYCDLKMTETVYGFVEKDVFSGATIASHFLNESLTYSFTTKGFVFRAPEPTQWAKEQSQELDMVELLGGTYHAIEHVLIEGGNSLSGGGAHEIGGVSLGTTGLIVIYDGAPGGSGLTKLLFDRFNQAIARVEKILKECSCNSRHGCPKCTHSYQCGNNNQPLDRIGAIESLKLFTSTKTRIDPFVSERVLV